MMVLRCTAKLLAKLDVRPVAACGPSTNVLGDWFATLLHSRRGQFVICMSRETLLPIVVSGRDLRTFPSRMASELADVLAVYKVPTALIAHERAEMSEVQYARTDDRSSVGVLTEFQHQLGYYLDDLPSSTLTELSLRLAQTPIVARDVFPDNATCALFGVPKPRHVRFF